MIILVSSAFFVGFVHSLAPGHWLPVALIARARRWNFGEALGGALLVAAGHIVSSTLVSVLIMLLGLKLAAGHEHVFEKYGGLFVAAFGIFYAAYFFCRHAKCRGHTHHGPDIKSGRRRPFVFLLLLGAVPCGAIVPLVGTALVAGAGHLLATVSAFSAGTVAALAGATLLARAGLSRLDHPVLEHYGDVIAGVAITVMGVVWFVAPF